MHLVFLIVEKYTNTIYSIFHYSSIFLPFAILTLWAFANFTIFVFASAFAIFFLYCMLMCTHCALSVCVLKLILMLEI